MYRMHTDIDRLCTRIKTMIIFNVTTPYTKAFCKIVNVNSMHKALEIEKSVTRHI